MQEKPEVVSQFNLMTVLLLENDESTAEVVKILLNSAGYLCNIQTKRTDILTLLEEINPNLVILDYRLSDVRGDHLCAMIKENNMWNWMPTIIYSACINLNTDIGLRYGDAFVQKPFDIDSFLQVIEKLIFNKSKFKNLLPFQG
jgi:DNA-binding response OmpR family regulator